MPPKETRKNSLIRIEFDRGSILRQGAASSNFKQSEFLRFYRSLAHTAPTLIRVDFGKTMDTTGSVMFEMNSEYSTTEAGEYRCN
jgi:hypothetical protein